MQCFELNVVGMQVKLFLNYSVKLSVTHLVKLNKLIDFFIKLYYLYELTLNFKNLTLNCFCVKH